MSPALGIAGIGELSKQLGPYNREMKFGRTTRRFVGWMATFALLLAAVAPTISQALVLVSRDSAAWAEICSTAGFRRVQSDPSGNQGEPSKPLVAMADHCQYCTLQSHAMAPPPAPIAIASLAPLTFEAPVLFATARRTLFAWIAAQPRGPPAYS